MGAAYRITECFVEAELPSCSSVGYPAEREQFQDDAHFDANKIGFEILDDEGGTVVRGYFVGDDNHRDWPLVSARRSIKVPSKPKRIEYDDGRKWVYCEDMGHVVEETTAAQ